MALSDRLINEVQFKCPGSTLNAIRMEVWNVLDDFCREGLAWRETVEIPLTAGDPSYTISVAGAEIVRAYSIDHATMDLRGAVYEFGNILLGTAPTVTEAATPAYIVVALSPAITQGADIENFIPIDIWSKFHRTFVKGMLGLMMAQPAKPYSNPQLAALYWRGYLDDRAVARRGADTNDIPGAQLWGFPRFGC